MNIPEELRYTKEHEWIKVENDTATVGITDFAQSELGDVVFAELPRVGELFKADQPFGSLESVKAVSEVYMPVAGEVTEVNSALSESPETINEDPYQKGWIIRIRPENPGDADDLMSAADYRKYIEEETKD